MQAGNSSGRVSASLLDRALESVCLKALASGRKTATPRRKLWPTTSRGGWPTSLCPPGGNRSHVTPADGPGENRTAVTAATVAVLAVILGLGAVAGVQARANGELRSLNDRLTRANAELAAEKSRVQERFDLAMEVIQTLHTGVSEDFLLKEVQFKGLHDRLLKSAGDFYIRLAELVKDRADRDSRRL